MHVPRTQTPARFFLRHDRTGIVPNRPWVVLDDTVGAVAQTDDGMTLAYYATRQRARVFMWRRNAQHWAGTCPEYIDWYSDRYGAYRATCLYLVNKDADDTRRAVAAVLARAGYPPPRP